MSQIQKFIFRNFATRSVVAKYYPKVTRTKNKALVESVALTQDQRVFLAWHPKKEIPYEFTRELPSISTQINDSLMKEEVLESAKQAYKTGTPDQVRQKLAQITFTTKHRWFPRSRDKKAKNTPMDRPFL